LYNKEEANKELINEKAKKAKFRLLGPFGKAHNIVVYIRSSGSCAKQFKKLVGRMILIDNRTR
jgi:hypothetical protein